MARSSEPHRRNDADDAAEWRSQNAMQTTCALFTAPGSTTWFYGMSWDGWMDGWMFFLILYGWMDVFVFHYGHF